MMLTQLVLEKVVGARKLLYQVLNLEDQDENVNNNQMEDNNTLCHQLV